MQFINAVGSVYLVHPAVEKRAQFLKSTVCYPIESQLLASKEHVTRLLSRFERKSQDFIGFSQKLITKTELEDKDIKQILRLFKESSQILGVNNILITPEQEEKYDRLYGALQKHKKLIQGSLCRVFNQSVESRVDELKKQYHTHQERQDNSI